jgi:hypothetical protein
VEEFAVRIAQVRVAMLDGARNFEHAQKVAKLVGEFLRD